MISPERDLLVLFNEELMSPQAMEHQVSLLHELLANVESFNNLLITHELIDIHSYRIYSTPHHMRRELRKRNMKPFVFLFNRN